MLSYVYYRSRSLLPETSRYAHSCHRTPLGPMAIHLFNVKTFVFFFLSLILLIDKGGVGLFYSSFHRVRVILRLAVYRQSVHLGAEPLETHGQNSFFN
jgi:hypothetical protein